MTQILSVADRIFIASFEARRIHDGSWATFNLPQRRIEAFWSAANTSRRLAKPNFYGGGVDEQETTQENAEPHVAQSPTWPVPSRDTGKVSSRVEHKKKYDCAEPVMAVQCKS